jgi:hypothetical protein
MKKLELTSFKLKTPRLDGSDHVFEEYANVVRYDDEPYEHTLERVHAFLHLEYPESEILSIRIGKTIDAERFKGMNEVARKGFIELFGTSDVFELNKLSDDDLIKVPMFGKKGIDDLRRFVDRWTYKPQIEEKK